MIARPFSKPENLLHFSVIAVLLLLILSHLPASYESYKIRQDVVAGLNLANNAKQVVVENALKGKNLAKGWVGSNGGVDVKINVDSYTGIIEVSYPGNIDGGGKTLNLIPFNLRTSEVYPLAGRINSKPSFAAGDIIWICVSKLTYSKAQSINEHRGTLQSKYAPAECRYSLR